MLIILNVNTISHTKSAFLCKIITHKITKTTTCVYCNSQGRACDC